MCKQRVFAEPASGRPLHTTQRHLLRGGPPPIRVPDPDAFFVEKEKKKRSYLSKSKPRPDIVPTTLTNFSSGPLKSAGGNMLVVLGKNDTLKQFLFIPLT